MRWNWQLPDWRKFRFENISLREAESRFLKQAGVILGAMQHLDQDIHQQLVLQLILQETMENSAIEGEALDRANVQLSLARQLKLARIRQHLTPAETGAAGLMTDQYQHYEAPLTERGLLDWHASLMKGRRDLDVVGGYRRHDETLQIISGPAHTPHIHFEAPPSREVAAEMMWFIDWFNRTAPTGRTPLPAIERAAIAHLWFESLHPFEDGNGQIGRVIAKKALAQVFEAPTLTALATTLRIHKKAYYEALDQARKTNQIDDWMIWFVTIVQEAQARTLRNIRFFTKKTHFLDRLHGQLNPRQEKAVLRMLADGPDGFRDAFQGGLSSENYRSLTKASPATATRDLVGLVSLGVLTRTGENRHARYFLTLTA